MTAPHAEANADFLISNIDEAKFDCTFGRGCEGICCRNGRPPVYDVEAARITANLKKFLPELRKAARRIVEKHGFLSRRTKSGQPMARVADGWCVFFNRGCVLHKIGAQEGARFLYKPVVCSLFPINRDATDRGYIRQKGLNGEPWDLFCLDPQASDVPAAQSLQDEIALARQHARAEREKQSDSEPDATTDPGSPNRQGSRRRHHVRPARAQADSMMPSSRKP
jgi:hypothetical protein